MKTCACASRDKKRPQSDRIGRQWEGCWGGSVVEDVGGWTRDDWASAVSSVHLHMAQCPTRTVLNDKSPAFPSS